MTAVVWLSSWQMECCGAPFSVGDPVDWTVEHDVDDSWLAAALGPEMAARITHAVEHHADQKDDLPRLSGQVVSILRAWGAFAPSGLDERTLYPVPGTARFLDVLESDGVERHAFSSLQFNGWVVEVLEKP